MAPNVGLSLALLVEAPYMNILPKSKVISGKALVKLNRLTRGVVVKINRVKNKTIQTRKKTLFTENVSLKFQLASGQRHILRWDNYRGDGMKWTQ